MCNVYYVLDVCFKLIDKKGYINIFIQVIVSYFISLMLMLNWVYWISGYMYICIVYFCI